MDFYSIFFALFNTSSVGKYPFGGDPTLDVLNFKFDNISLASGK